MSNLKWLQEWYNQNCDGWWEHLYGVIIETLDNPGWHVKIELHGTNYVDLQSEELKWDKGDDDWLKCSISRGVFDGCGDSMKLEMIIEIFKKWIEECE